jgi:hypothetical protein
MVISISVPSRQSIDGFRSAKEGVFLYLVEGRDLPNYKESKNQTLVKYKTSATSSLSCQYQSASIVKHTEVKVSDLESGGVLLALFSSLVLRLLVVNSEQGDVVRPVLAWDLLEPQLEDLRIAIRVGTVKKGW